MMAAAAAASTRLGGHSPRPCVEWSGEAGRRRQEQAISDASIACLVGQLHPSNHSWPCSRLLFSRSPTARSCSPVPLTTHYSLAPPPSQARPAPLSFLLPSLPSLPPPSIVSWLVYQADHHHRHHRHHHHHSQRRGGEHPSGTGQQEHKSKTKTKTKSKGKKQDKDSCNGFDKVTTDDFDRWISQGKTIIGVDPGHKELITAVRQYTTTTRPAAAAPVSATATAATSSASISLSAARLLPTGPLPDVHHVHHHHHHLPPPTSRSWPGKTERRRPTSPSTTCPTSRTTTSAALQRRPRGATGGDKRPG